MHDLQTLSERNAAAADRYARAAARKYNEAVASSPDNVRFNDARASHRLSVIAHESVIEIRVSTAVHWGRRGYQGNDGMSMVTAALQVPNALIANLSATLAAIASGIDTTNKGE